MPFFKVYHRSVTQEAFLMNGHNRLIRRNHTYYLRARIPTALVYLIHKSQFWYSLKTNNYYEALEKISKESYKVDMKINLLKALDMKIKSGHLLFDAEDIDKIVINKLKQVENVFENYFDEIERRKYDYSNMLIFNKETASTNDKQHELDCVELAVKEYFRDTLEDERTHKAVTKQIEKIQKQEIPVIEDKQHPDEEIKKIKTALTGVEKYILDKIYCIEENIEFNKSLNPRVKRCLDIIHAEQNEKARRETTSTPWRKVFDEFALDKSNNRRRQSTIEQNRQCLETIFEIIGKKYVEAVTYKDCQKASRLLYNLPKKWKERYKGRKLSDLIAQPRSDAISLTSVKKYQRILKEFLLYCKNKRYINLRKTEQFNSIIQKHF